MWGGASDGATLALENPSDGTPLASVVRGTAAGLDAAVAAARSALEGDCGRATTTERGRVLSATGRKVRENVELLTHLEALDVGKPLKQRRADAVALARYCEFYGGAADEVHGETLPFQAGYTALTLREPHGLTGHIVPWNCPMQIVGRSGGAALAIGNACALKPAEEACLTVLAFARIAAEAGLPPGALNVVPRLGEEAGAALAAHAGVQHLLFTGSVATAALIEAAAARNAVPVTLALAGKSPQIVFADADLDATLPSLVNAGLQNAGQTCSAASRILVERQVFDAVRERMVERYRALRIGAALADLDMGPVISARQQQVIENFLALGRDSGLAVAAQGTGGADAPRGGHCVRPLLFADVPPDHALAQQEIFGRLQVMIGFEGEAETLAIANGTAYGLVAGVWIGVASRASNGMRQRTQKRAETRGVDGRGGTGFLRRAADRGRRQTAFRPRAALARTRAQWRGALASPHAHLALMSA